MTALMPHATPETPRTADSTRATPPPDLTRLRRLGAATQRVALSALLRAHELLGLAAGRHLREARAHDDPLRHLHVRLEETQLQARLAWECVDLLRARLGKIPDQNRPYYTPAQRFQILEIKRLLGWTRAETAAVFRVCPSTISNWEGQVQPGLTTVGSTVQPTPPVVRLSDAVRSLVQTMKRLGFGSDDLIALTLVRAGWKISVRTVGRILREPLRPAPALDTPEPPDKPQRPVKAHFVNHVWMADLSEVRAFLGGTFYMAALFDAFSRVPLAFQTFDHKPDSRETAGLLKRALRAFGKPRYLITDRGPEFQGAFRKLLARLGVFQRHRSKDSLAATARLESFWRTLKNMASLRLPFFLTIEDLERRLAPALFHYLCFRPHHGLHGATPAEALCGVEPACRRAGRAPRGRAGEGSLTVPFRIQMLAPHEKRFPVLIPAGA